MTRLGASQPELGDGSHDVAAAAEDQVVAAVDIGGTKAKVAIVSATHGVLGTAAIPSGPETHTSRLLADVAEAIDGLAREARRSPSQPLTVIAAGVVTPGVVSASGIALAPNNPGMDALTAESLQSALGLAALEWANDVKAAALAEHSWGALQGARSGLYINLGTGLSAGAVIEGRALHGARGAALEIGYLLPTGTLGPGHRSGAAPLEDRISGRAMQDRAAAAGFPGMTASEILHGRTSGNQVLADLAAEFVDQLVRAVVNLAITLDADAICFGGGMAGGMGGAADVFLDPVRSALAEYAPYPPRVALSDRPNDSSLFGAIRIAFSAAGWRTEGLSNPYAQPPGVEAAVARVEDSDARGSANATA